MVRINLIYKQRKYEKKAKKFRYIRRVALLLAFVTLCVGLALLIYRSGKDSLYAKLLNEKEVFLQTMLTKKEKERKLRYLGHTSLLLKKVAPDNLVFLDYYDTLKPFIPEGSDEALLVSLTMDQDRALSMDFEYNQYPSFLSHLALLESESFRSLFESVSLQKISGSDSLEAGYKLSVQGTMKSLAVIAHN